jgi:hypothetical protein
MQDAMSDLVDRIVESLNPVPDGKHVKMASVHKRALSKSDVRQPYIIARAVELPIPQPCKEMKDQRNV